MTKTILEVDRDTSISDWLRYLFEEVYDFRVAQSLDDAIDLLSHSHFDLIITEAFNQSQMFDFDPAYLSRLGSQARNTPIILFSTYVSSTIGNWSTFGPAGVLPKPTDLNDVIEKITGALGESRCADLSVRHQFSPVGPSSGYFIASNSS